MDELDKREVLRFVTAVENGSIPAADIYQVLEKFDPLLSYFLLRYLREKHPISDTSTGAGARLLELLQTYPNAAKLAATPKDEPMVDWFNDSYALKTFFSKPEDYINLIIDKMEG